MSTSKLEGHLWIKCSLTTCNENSVVSFYLSLSVTSKYKAGLLQPNLRAPQLVGLNLTITYTNWLAATFRTHIPSATLVTFTGERITAGARSRTDNIGGSNTSTSALHDLVRFGAIVLDGLGAFALAGLAVPLFLAVVGQTQFGRVFAFALAVGSIPYLDLRVTAAAVLFALARAGCLIIRLLGAVAVARLHDAVFVTLSVVQTRDRPHRPGTDVIDFESDLLGFHCHTSVDLLKEPWRGAAAAVKLHVGCEP